MEAKGLGITKKGVGVGTKGFENGGREADLIYGEESNAAENPIGGR